MKTLQVQLRRRVYTLLGLFFLVVALLTAELYRQQVVNRDHHLAWAKKQQLQPVRLIPLRGKILDRRETPMAVSLEGGSLFSHPAAVRDPDRTARLLAPYLETDVRPLQDKLELPVSFVWLARQLPLRKAKAIQRLGLSGIGMEREGRRYYPNRDLASNVIGFVGVDSQGLEGLELYYDRHVRGAKGSLLLQRDARGRLLWREVAGSPESARGRELVLTLDLRIQYAAERALRQGVADAGASSGSAVVLDPGTGEVLAMACVPTFNPNRYHAYGPGWWRNRCITDSFEPGSTVKPFLLAAGMEEGLVSEETTFDCEKGAYFFGGHWIHDMEPHGELTALEVIKNSSNIGATKMAERLQARALWEYLNAFGFGRKTGIDLPGEVAGTLRPWQQWSRVALATHAFGQGFSITTLQLATAFAALANGGFLIEPFVVKEMRDHRGVLLEARQPKAIRRVASKETVDRVLAVLEAVVEQGTGQRAKVRGFRVAGKTGTAQRFEKERNAYANDRPVVSFVGAVPAEEPQVVIAVVLHEAEGKASGGLTAAPVFQAIAASSLHYLRLPGRVLAKAEPAYTVQPCSAQGVEGGSWEEKVVDSRIRSVGPPRMPDVRMLPLRIALRALEGLPLQIQVQGSGRVVRQVPPPGALLRTGDVLRLAGSTDFLAGLSEEGTGGR